MTARFPHLAPETEEVGFNLEEMVENFTRLAVGKPTPPKYRLVFDVLGTNLL